MNQSTKWYRANKHRPEVRKKANARQRKWYRKNLDHARAAKRANQKKRWKEHRADCLASTERCRKKRGARNRHFIEAYKSFFGCRDCGERDPICLDLDHRDPRDKKFTVAKWLWRASLHALAVELEKCDVRCANCHRKRHRDEAVPTSGERLE